MAFISYAQNFEDVMLWRALKQIENGFYVDVGAQDPVIDSVSLAFYEHGWRGVHIEPTAIYAEKLRQQRPDEVVIRAAVGAASGAISFFEIPDTGLSTADSEIAQRHGAQGFDVRETVVPCLTLTEVLQPYWGRDIHWMKIDVEGFEEEVIAGWDVTKIRPWIVVIESTLPNSREETYQTWEPLVLGMGYAFAYFDGLNRYYISADHLELVSAFDRPPNVFDFFVSAQMTMRDTEIGRLNADIAWQKTGWDGAKAELARIHEELGRRDAKIERLSADIDRLNAHIAWQKTGWDGAKAELTQNWSHLAARNAEIGRIYRSRSWKLTKPLRDMNFVRLSTIGGLQRATERVTNLFRAPQDLPRHAAFWILRRPHLATASKQILARFPALNARIRRHVWHVGPPSQSTIESPSQKAPAASLEEGRMLSEGAARVLRELQRAMGH